MGSYQFKFRLQGISRVSTIIQVLMENVVREINVPKILINLDDLTIF